MCKISYIPHKKSLINPPILNNSIKPSPIPRPQLNQTTLPQFCNETIKDIINISIVSPLKEAFIGTCVRSLYLTEWGCIIAASTGVIFSICGIDSGKRMTRISLVIYIGIQIVKVVFI